MDGRTPKDGGGEGGCRQPHKVRANDVNVVIEYFGLNDLG